MRSWQKKLGGAAFVVLLLGGYATADAFDLVPGILTLEPEAEPAPPEPTAPGALAPQEVPSPEIALSPEAPLPRTGQLQEIVDELTDSEISDSMSVYVTDALTGEVLLDHNGQTPRTPASTTKLLSGLLALDVLGPERTLKTTVATNSGDELVLIAGGDMLLAVGEGDPEALVGRAGMGTLAAQTEKFLALKGTTSVTLVLDDTLFSGPGSHPSWNLDLVDANLAPPVAAIAVNEGKNRAPQYEDAAAPPRYDDIALDAAGVFAAALEERGIEVRGEIKRGVKNADAQEIAGVESAPIRDIVYQSLLVSDNVLAEILSRLVAVEIGYPGSFSGGAEAMIHQLEKRDLPTAGLKLIDGSGLSPDALITPRLEVELLTLALNNPQMRDGVARLPTANYSGTLSSRMGGGQGAGTVRAKTGGLTGARSLAGTIVTADQRLLVFSAMADPDFPDGGWIAERNIDWIAERIAACGCVNSASDSD